VQELFVAQDFGGGEFMPPLAGQAVKAPQIAAIGDGEAQIIDVSAGTAGHVRVQGEKFKVKFWSNPTSGIFFILS
jgi:hypothetical protein